MNDFIDCSCPLCHNLEDDCVCSDKSTRTCEMISEIGGWKRRLTPTELTEWDKYDAEHLHLQQIPMPFVMDMFLNHFRRGINLNHKSS